MGSYWNIYKLEWDGDGHCYGVPRRLHYDGITCLRYYDGYAKKYKSM